MDRENKKKYDVTSYAMFALFVVMLVGLVISSYVLFRTVTASDEITERYVRTYPA